MTTEYIAPDWQVLKNQVVEAGSNLYDAELRLADKRKSVDAVIAKLNASFEASNAELIQEAAEWSEILSHADGALRESILEDYEVNGEKQIFLGLSVRINTSYEFEDADAVAFAIDRKMPEVLQPKKTEFKKLMSIQPQPFCTITETPSAVVSLKS